MLFTSLEFLFLFLPICLAVYFVLPRHLSLRNYWLLAMSLCFYAWGEPRFVLVMLASIAFNYLMALLVSATANQRRGLARLFLWLAILGNLSVIGIWKYANFVTACLLDLLPSWQGFIPRTSILLPIGISFFTFQALSYVIDVFRGEAKVQRNPLYMALYIAMFPQLVAGPIVRYATVCGQLETRHETLAMFSDGVIRFLYGFNKKMLLANSFAVPADAIFGMGEMGCSLAWLGAVCYGFQIFFDFSGYSDMAIGLGRMFGFNFQENFNFPYVSKSVTEFWRRWHISLGSWFRDYVYFPLGGSRVGRMRLVFNLLVVWLLTGIWHGANWTFVAWGILYGVIIMFEKLTGLSRKIDEGSVLRCFWQPFTILVVLFGWVIFRSPDLAHAVHYLKTMLSFSTDSMFPRFAFELREVTVPLIAAVLLSTPFFAQLRQYAEKSRGSWLYRLGDGTLQMALFVVGVSCLVMETHNPFIYFNF